MPAFPRLSRTNSQRIAAVRETQLVNANRIAGASGAAAAAEMVDQFTGMGDLADLNTVAQGSLVEAINEVNAGIGAGGGGLSRAKGRFAYA